MNEKAIELGLQSTSFADPSGLNANNVSSAFDLSHLITFAASDDRISSIMRTPTYTVATDRRMIPIHSTNHIVMNGDVEVMAGKTGFHHQVGLLPGDAASSAPGQPGRRRRARRDVEQRPLLETRHLFSWLNTKAAALFKDQGQPSDK
jgi:D-alanyl-D-alanine endopeptidase (penicillin-binding protein 7)